MGTHPSQGVAQRRAGGRVGLLPVAPQGGSLAVGDARRRRGRLSNYWPRYIMRRVSLAPRRRHIHAQRRVRLYLSYAPPLNFRRPLKAENLIYIIFAYVCAGG
jgi:hypothetical protein